MIAVLTGDIVNSREISTQLWLNELKDELRDHGAEWKDWEIFRGDSFQLKLEPSLALQAGFLLKARIKQFKELDVRIAIGIGTIDFIANRVSESSGTAFSHSGACFDELKKSNMEIRSPWEDFDRTMNLMLNLASLTTDYWTPTSSQLIWTGLKYPDLNQIELAEKLLKKSQGTVSEGLKRGGYEEIQKLLVYFSEELIRIC